MKLQRFFFMFLILMMSLLFISGQRPGLQRASLGLPEEAEGRQDSNPGKEPHCDRGMVAWKFLNKKLSLKSTRDVL